MKQIVWIFLFFCISALNSALAEPVLSASEIKTEQQAILKKLGKRPELFAPWRSESVRSVVLERVQLSSDRSVLRLYCNVGLAQISIRQELIDRWANAVREELGDAYASCEVRFYAYNVPIERFIPNYYRPRNARDPKRESTPLNRRPLVRRIDRPLYGRGLDGRHIALWGGHGLYYHQEEDSAWVWQRPALFGTIEDLNTQEFATQYVAPMLERAGAVVVMARERDPQRKEVIVDNDRSTAGAWMERTGGWRTLSGGFRWQDTLHTQNPFREGTVLQAKIEQDMKPSITYFPALQQRDTYGVYVSWKALPSNLSNARYTVYHAGGKAEFEVNQRIGGSMWVWLGSFVLDSASKIVLSAPDGVSEGTLTADAVKIGGGMGQVERAGTVSGGSRYAEAARYWMQYSGVPDSIYAQETLSNENKEGKMLDYIDNFKGNGDWCNYIRKQRGVPLDMAVGLHTDAGICDSITGTLSIHYTDRTRAHYTNGRSKLSARDLADLVQTQIVSDLRAKYDPRWTRRSMYDKSYAEISRPDMPAILVEMFSHQNIHDMAIAMDPAFRFDMARAIYKGILRFLADRYGRAYTVQPLPPSVLRGELLSGDTLRLSWQATRDPLESSALPNRYRVYRRVGVEGAFDDGVEVHSTQLLVPLPRDGQVYSYRVTAVNDGGESFPSETISAGLSPVNDPAGYMLVVNGFTRVSPPALKYDETGRPVGFDIARDPGVPYLHDHAIVGPQHDFNPLSPFEDNHRPGWGASSAEWAETGVAGNTFDYAARYGASALQRGVSFVSTSRAAFEQNPVQPSRLRSVSLLFGAQRSYPKRYTIFSSQIVKRLRSLIDAQVPLVVSGAYIGSDPSATDEVKQLLGYSSLGTMPNPEPMNAGAYYTPTLDRLAPLSGGKVINDNSTAVQKGGVLVFGFPIEVLPEEYPQ